MPLLRQEANLYVGALPDGIEGIEATLALMSQVVNVYKKDPEITALARDTITGLAKRYAAQAAALLRLVQENVQYTLGPEGVQQLQTPDNTLAMGHGYCTDMATLLASLLASVGHPTRFIAASIFQQPMWHVWVQTKIGDRWVDADATMEDAPLGWAPPGIEEWRIYHN